MNGQLEIVGTAGDNGGGAVAVGNTGAGKHGEASSDEDDDDDDDNDDGDTTNVYAKPPTITLRFVDAAGKSLTSLTLDIYVPYFVHPRRASNPCTPSLFIMAMIQLEHER